MPKNSVKEEQIAVGRYENEFDAEIARGHLEAEGIDANIGKDDAGGMLPSLQQTSGVQLFVAETLAVRAREILNAKANGYAVSQ